MRKILSAILATALILGAMTMFAFTAYADGDIVAEATLIGSKQVELDGTIVVTMQIKVKESAKISENVPTEGIKEFMDFNVYFEQSELALIAQSGLNGWTITKTDSGFELSASGNGVTSTLNVATFTFKALKETSSTEILLTADYDRNNDLFWSDCGYVEGTKQTIAVVPKTAAPGSSSAAPSSEPEESSEALPESSDISSSADESRPSAASEPNGGDDSSGFPYKPLLIASAVIAVLLLAVAGNFIFFPKAGLAKLLKK